MDLISRQFYPKSYFYILDISKFQIISFLILLKVILQEDIYLPIWLKENILQLQYKLLPSPQYSLLSFHLMNHNWAIKTFWYLNVQTLRIKNNRKT